MLTRRPEQLFSLDTNVVVNATNVFESDRALQVQAEELAWIEEHQKTLPPFWRKMDKLMSGEKNAFNEYMVGFLRMHYTIRAQAEAIPMQLYEVPENFTETGFKPIMDRYYEEQLKYGRLKSALSRTYRDIWNVHDDFARRPSDRFALDFLSKAVKYYPNPDWFNGGLADCYSIYKLCFIRDRYQEPGPKDTAIFEREGREPDVSDVRTVHMREVDGKLVRFVKLDGKVYIWNDQNKLEGFQGEIPPFKRKNKPSRS